MRVHWWVCLLLLLLVTRGFAPGVAHAGVDGAAAPSMSIEWPSYGGNDAAGTKSLLKPCYSLRLERGIDRYGFRRKRFASYINTSSLVGCTQVAAFLWKLVATWQNMPRSVTFT